MKIIERFIEKWPNQFSGLLRQVFKSFYDKKISREKARKELAIQIDVALNTIRLESKDRICFQEDYLQESLQDIAWMMGESNELENKMKKYARRFRNHYEDDWFLGGIKKFVTSENEYSISNLAWFINFHVPGGVASWFKNAMRDKYPEILKRMEKCGLS